MQTINFYKHIPEKYLKPLATYENIDQVQLDLPVRIVIAGGCGTGKTNAVMNIINQFNCFDKFYLYIGDTHESLYTFLIDTVKKQYGKECILVSDDIMEIPEIEEFDPSINSLVIIDDMINEKGNKERTALNLFTKGRRANISTVYITQDFFKVNLTVRKNSKVLILTRFNDPRDLDMILMKYKQRMSLDEIRNLYEYAIDGGMENFFTIDTEASGSKRYRKNFTPI